MTDPLSLLQPDRLPGQPAPVVRRGADDQAAAYAALLAQWADVDAEADERDWQRVRADLDAERRSSGQHLLFDE